jgi:hypothetical protein
MVDNITVRAAGARTYPVAWGRWSDLVRSGRGPSALGLDCSHADLNRFAARFRVARSFQSVGLVDYSAGTIAGYSGLFHVFLAWSAVDSYLRLMHLRQSDCAPWSERYLPARLAASVRRLDRNDRFYSFVASKVRHDAKVQLAQYLSNRPFNQTYLASTVRHIFAHGDLTPSASNAEPTAVQSICRLVVRAHLRLLSDDFRARVAEVG